MSYLAELGYWRSNIYSENIYFCEIFLERCLGGEGVDDSLCEYGYTAPLCSSCIAGFSKQSRGTCLRCSSKIWNIFSFFLLMIGFSIFLLLMIL